MVNKDVYIAQCGKNDLKVILGDFNAVTGSTRIQGETRLVPCGSGIPNANTDLPMSFCRGTISVLQDLGSTGRTFTTSPGFPAMGTHRLFSNIWCCKVAEALY